MDKYDYRRQRLRALIDELAEGVPAVFADKYDYSRAQVSQYLSKTYNKGHSIGDGVITEIETRTKRPGWFNPSPGAMEPMADYAVVGSGATPSEDDYLEVKKNFDVQGSCGGGKLNYEERLKEPVAFRRSWYARKGVRAEDLVAIYADGDSMADFIVDGDMVLFDTTKTEIRSGKIYAISHPEGVRIKTLRQELDGTIVLSGLNPDKRKYPDEPIPPEKTALLRVIGEFVHRAGG